MSTVIVSAEGLQAFCHAVLAKSLPEAEAAVIAETLVDANLLGVSSHGVTRLTDYLNRMEDGLIEKRTHVTVVQETAATAVLDAGNGWGQVVSVQAMNLAIDKALQYGTGFVGVRNSNHYGTASYFARMAAERDCIGFSMTNASPVMVPFGAKEPSLGTNPLCIAVPAGPGRDPVLLDMATSNVARGKITLAHKNGERIPADWAITADGRPTTDAAEALAGFMLPMGAKGSGLAIMIDILTGVLTGALFGKAIPRMYDDPAPQQLGHMFGAISIAAFMDKEAFYDRLQSKIKETVESAPASGFDRVYMPGEIELAKKYKQLKEGIALSQEIFQELTKTGQRYGVDIGSYVYSTKGA